MASLNSFLVTIQSGRQTIVVPVFADNTTQAIQNAKNQTIGKLGINSRFTIVSIAPASSCGLTAKEKDAAEAACYAEGKGWNGSYCVKPVPVGIVGHL